MKKKLSNILPWVIALALFALIFKKTPPGKIRAILASAHVGFFVGSSFLYFMVMMALDALGLTWALNRFTRAVGLVEVLMARGVTYLLMIVNYNLGQGALAFYFKKTHGIPIFKTLGVLFFTTLYDLALILNLALLSFALGTQGPTANFASQLKATVWLFDAGFIAWILFWMLASKNSLALFSKTKIMAWLLKRDSLSAFAHSRPSDHLKIILARLPVLGWLVLGFYAMLNSFRLSIPLSDILINAPVLLLVGTLPLTPAGMGTTQLLGVELFKKSVALPPDLLGNFTPEDMILSAMLLWSMANLIYKVLFGLFCLLKTSKDLFTNAGDN